MIESEEAQFTVENNDESETDDSGLYLILQISENLLIFLYVMDRWILI